ncbi:Ankyrin repeat-containing domain [Pseudocohnilembus persalinus]|uniref:Ankyrin repeat-containing domain n=1 Tax=Pseudocohnilembus persalinus TaxID=266149 RepID=A0A0V0QP08_PSEPJ|nr:Ankyrin repeat-containing domain [Pseudocohnilembus persalinus]|eukprot:KRX04041.1 Ankyrin repeat-containing domain [Pseudocohnilembus persalinus]
MNIRTKEGWSPLGIAVIFDSIECLNLLLQVGGIDLIQKDIQKNDLFYLAEYYGAIDCFESLQTYKQTILNQLFQQQRINIRKKQQYQPQSLKIQINRDMLIDSQQSLENLFSKFDIGKSDINQHPLCINGKRKPCKLCQKNMGYILYTKCCQEPIHLICYDILVENKLKFYKNEQTENNENYQNQEIQIKCQFCQNEDFYLEAQIKNVFKAFE